MATPLILVVENDPAFRGLERAALENAGYRVATAANGEDALAYLRGTEDRPGLIVLDLAMPLMDGFAFRSLQLDDPDLASIPAVIVSGVALTPDEEERLRPAARLTKPLDFQGFLAAVAAHAQTG